MTRTPPHRLALRLALGVVLAAAAACAPKAPDLPVAGGVSRYPDFIFPAIPGDLGTPAAHERHKAGWLWLQAGDLRAAERNFDATLKLVPEFYPAETALGYVALARKDHREAASHFDRAVVMNPRYVPALVGRGEALLALGNRDQALKSFEAAVASDADLSALRSRIEVLRFRGLQEDVAEARKAAETGRLDDARTAYRLALSSSPQSPFLLRELAAVEQRAGNLAEALTLAQQAAELEPNEPRGLVLLGELHEAQGDLARAIEVYEASVAIEPNDATESRIDALREKLLLAALPPEFHAIPNSSAVSRADLAALMGVWLDDVIKRSPRRSAVLITDVRGNWASPWIQAVTRAGVMEAYPNHTFQPAAMVRRSDLAHAASRVLSLIARERPALAAGWRSSRRRFLDVSQGHPAYAAVSLVVEAGVMRPADDGSFLLSRPVSGVEAVTTVKRLEELAQRSTR
jgi:tetratricopeptide (TPR) repeat protein